VKRIIPEPWKGMDYYRKLNKLVGVPVINVHLWCASPRHLSAGFLPLSAGFSLVPALSSCTVPV